MELLEELKVYESDFAAKISEAADLEKLESVRIEFLGRKGKLADLMAKLPGLDPADKPVFGKLVNQLKSRLQQNFEDHKLLLENKVKQAASSSFDDTFPGRGFWRGSLHPVSIVTEEICDIFSKLGFDIVSGPEVEIDWYNFEALNLPPDHPARDMQDTLYITDKVLMRTHTSPVQVRTMLARKPPLAIIAPGKVYRRDSDLTHTPMFHQIEGLMVGERISMADLHGILIDFARAIFGKETKMRFRPSFFPFTEPSAEADISCAICGGSGKNGNEDCRVCKGTGWVEILGCGMVDPAVFKAVNYSLELSGFAFGMGVERITMLKYGINDLRLFFQNDVRFLSQFGILG